MAKAPPIERLTEKAAREAGVPVDLFKALILQGERSHKGWQTSPAGAFGPAQLMPGTAAGLAKRYGINPKDYYGNLLGGAYYLKEQLQRFKDPQLAIAAYNAGPGAVAKYNGVPPYAETQRYVANILGKSGAPSLSLTPSAPGPGAPESSPAPAGFETVSPLQMAAPTDNAISILQRLGGTAARAASAAQQPIPEPLPQQSSTPGLPDVGGSFDVPTAMPLPQGGSGSVKGLNAEFNRRLQALMQAVGAAGGELYVFSGARDAAKQAQLYRDAVAKYGSEQAARKWVAPPGKSNHDPNAGTNKGLGAGALAADLRGDLAMAHKLATKFGLVFPLSNEAWHIELAGARGK